MDWLHAILHKLEGDFRNAKMWYSDLGSSVSCPAFAQFWSSSDDGRSSVVDLTAAQHTDLIAFTCAKAGTFFPEKYYESTTASADKIEKSGSALSLSDLQALVTQKDPENSRRAGLVMQLELLWLLHRMQSDFGWTAMDAAQTTAAFQEQSRREDVGPHATQRKDQAKDMVFGASGQRKF